MPPAPNPELDAAPKLLAAVLAVVSAVRGYLPGEIDKDEFIDRVIAAVDNPEINPVIARAEGREIGIEAGPTTIARRTGDGK